MDPLVAYFDGVAEVYDEVLPFFATMAAQAVALLDPAPAARALDVAAGRGALTTELVTRGLDVVAVDASTRMVQLLRRDLPAADVRVMDARELSFRDEEFDLVVSGFALHIIEEGERAFAEMCRVLRPGGRLALVLPGRADGGEDPWDDPLVDLLNSYRRFATQGPGRTHNDVDEAELLEASDLVEVTATTLEIDLPVTDGETYWRFVCSHGSGRVVDALPADRRSELHAALVARADALPRHLMRRSATLWLARKPD